MIIIKHSDALGHIVPQGHPERPERWQAVSDMIEADFLIIHLLRQRQQAIASFQQFIHNIILQVCLKMNLKIR